MPKVGTTLTDYAWVSALHLRAGPRPGPPPAGSVPEPRPFGQGQAGRAARAQLGIWGRPGSLRCCCSGFHVWNTPC